LGAAVPHRFAATLMFAFVATLAAAATTATAATSAPAAPGTVVHRGQPAHLTIRTSSRGQCAAEVVYSDGALQQTGIKSARSGRVTWTIRIPTNASLGTARWTVRCGIQFRQTGTWRVQPVTASGGGAGAGGGTASAGPTVMVDKQGFSQRPDSYGGGSTFSYGLLLKNTSTSEDATQVYVLINFATESGALIGTVTRTIETIGADELYALGDSAQLRTQAPVTKLEVTIRVMSHVHAKPRPMPHFANVRILAGENDPDYVAEVDGEVVNDTSPLTLTMAKLSVVLLDASGKIVGGGTGLVYSPLPSGSRMVFLAQTGFTGIPSSAAVVPIITVEPTYATT
jgi:hypothetical protein